MKNTVTAAGYLSVGVYVIRGKPPETRLVHKMVIEAFVGGPPSEKHTDVRHLDGNNANCALYNLAWGTRSENMQDVWNHRQLSGGVGPAGMDPTRRKWYTSIDASDRVVRVTLELINEGKLNIRDAARLWGCSAGVAASLVHGETNRPVPQELVAEKKTKRTAAQRAAISELVAEGKGFKEINEALGESLTAQDVYYYRSKAAAKK
jgi:hypothetical protein